MIEGRFSLEDSIKERHYASAGGSLAKEKPEKIFANINKIIYNSPEYEMIINILIEKNKNAKIITGDGIPEDIERSISELQALLEGKIKSKLGGGLLTTDALAGTVAFISPPGYGKTKGITSTLEQAKRSGIIKDYVVYDAMGHNEVTAPLAIIGARIVEEDIKASAGISIDDISAVYSFMQEALFNKRTLGVVFKNYKMASSTANQSDKKSNYSTISNDISNVKSAYNTFEKIGSLLNLSSAQSISQKGSPANNIVRILFYIAKQCIDALYVVVYSDINKALYADTNYGNKTKEWVHKSIQRSSNRIHYAIGLTQLMIDWITSNVKTKIKVKVESSYANEGISESNQVGTENISNYLIKIYLTEILSFLQSVEPAYVDTVAQSLASILEANAEIIGISDFIIKEVEGVKTVSVDAGTAQILDIDRMLKSKTFKVSYEQLLEVIAEYLRETELRDVLDFDFSGYSISEDFSDPRKSIVGSISRIVVQKPKSKQYSSKNKNLKTFSIEREKTIYYSDVESLFNADRNEDAHTLVHIVDVFNKLSVHDNVSHFLSKIYLITVKTFGYIYNLFYLSSGYSYNAFLAAHYVQNIDFDNTPLYNVLREVQEAYSQKRTQMSLIFPEIIENTLNKARKDYERWYNQEMGKAYEMQGDFFLPTSINIKKPPIYVMFIDELFHLFSSSTKGSGTISTLWDGLSNRQSHFPPNVLLILAGNSPTAGFWTLVAKALDEGGGGNIVQQDSKVTISADSLKAFFERVAVRVIYPDQNYLIKKSYEYFLNPGVVQENKNKVTKTSWYNPAEATDLIDYFVSYKYDESQKLVPSQPLEYDYYKAIVEKRYQALLSSGLIKGENNVSTLKFIQAMIDSIVKPKSSTLGDKDYEVLKNGILDYMKKNMNRENEKYMEHLTEFMKNNIKTYNVLAFSHIYPIIFSTAINDWLIVAAKIAEKSRSNILDFSNVYQYILNGDFLRGHDAKKDQYSIHVASAIFTIAAIKFILNIKNNIWKDNEGEKIIDSYASMYDLMLGVIAEDKNYAPAFVFGVDNIEDYLDVINAVYVLDRDVRFANYEVRAILVEQNVDKDKKPFGDAYFKPCQSIFSGSLYMGAPDSHFIVFMLHGESNKVIKAIRYVHYMFFMHAVGFSKTAKIHKGTGNNKINLFEAIPYENKSSISVFSFPNYIYYIAKSGYNRRSVRDLSTLYNEVLWTIKAAMGSAYKVYWVFYNHILPNKDTKYANFSKQIEAINDASQYWVDIIWGLQPIRLNDNDLSLAYSKWYSYHSTAENSKQLRYSYPLMINLTKEGKYHYANSSILCYYLGKMGVDEYAKYVDYDLKLVLKNANSIDLFDFLSSKKAENLSYITQVIIQPFVTHSFSTYSDDQAGNIRLLSQLSLRMNSIETAIINARDVNVDVIIDNVINEMVDDLSFIENSLSVKTYFEYVNSTFKNLLDEILPPVDIGILSNFVSKVASLYSNVKENIGYTLSRIYKYRNLIKKDVFLRVYDTIREGLSGLVNNTYSNLDNHKDVLRMYLSGLWIIYYVLLESSKVQSEQNVSYVNLDIIKRRLLFITLVSILSTVRADLEKNYRILSKKSLSYYKSVLQNVAAVLSKENGISTYVNSLLSGLNSLVSNIKYEPIITEHNKIMEEIFSGVSDFINRISLLSEKENIQEIADTLLSIYNETIQERYSVVLYDTNNNLVNAELGSSLILNSILVLLRQAKGDETYKHILPITAFFELLSVRDGFKNIINNLNNLLDNRSQNNIKSIIDDMSIFMNSFYGVINETINPNQFHVLDLALSHAKSLIEDRYSKDVENLEKCILNIQSVEKTNETLLLWPSSFYIDSKTNKLHVVNDKAPVNPTGKPGISQQKAFICKASSAPDSLSSFVYKYVSNSIELVYVNIFIENQNNIEKIINESSLLQKVEAEQVSHIKAIDGIVYVVLSFIDHVIGFENIDKSVKSEQKLLDLYDNIRNIFKNVESYMEHLIYRANTDNFNIEMHLIDFILYNRKLISYSSEMLSNFATDISVYDINNLQIKTLSKNKKIGLKLYSDGGESKGSEQATVYVAPVSIYDFAVVVKNLAE
jgi:hypothetical protein